MAVASHATVTPHVTVTPKASVTPKSSGSTSAKSGSKAPSSSETGKSTTKSETKAQNGSHSAGKAMPHDFAQYSAANSNMYSNTYKDLNTVGYCGNNAFNTTFPYLWMMNNSNHATTTEEMVTAPPVEESVDTEIGQVMFVTCVAVFFMIVVICIMRKFF